MKRLNQVATKLVEQGHSHAPNIQDWVSAVDKQYQDFSARMDKYRLELETELGMTSEVWRSPWNISFRFSCISKSDASKDFMKIRKKYFMVK